MEHGTASVVSECLDLINLAAGHYFPILQAAGCLSLRALRESQICNYLRSYWHFTFALPIRPL